MAELLFLGSGGGRFATIHQRRATGGLFINAGVKLHVDPGPGALVQMHRFRVSPESVDALLISHSHTDHYTDAEVLIEAITRGGLKRRGTLIASESVIEGVEGIGPAISSYHRSLLKEVIALRPGEEARVGDVVIRATRCVHHDPTTIGFFMEMKGGPVAYVADTEYAEEVVEDVRGARVLILPVTRPLGMRIPSHLSTEDAAIMVENVKPELAVITHFGLRMLEKDPDYQADWIWKKTGVRTIAADDGMRVILGKRIIVE